ncbi:MAG: hypothetical protein KC425_26320, partial [Anaerolineales bacterium]|nr:hypothetical protein [Anaerolineales bacterium]
MTFTVPLHAAAAADAARVGQKAAALHRLLRAGFPVPAGVCVPTAVFTAAVAPHAPAIAAALAAVDAAAPHTAV